MGVRRLTVELTEAMWQQQVLELAAAFGWMVLVVRKSIGKGNRWVTATNIVGWPDCLCFKTGAGFIALELKVGRNKPTREQVEVLKALQAAGAQTMVAYPEDFDALVEMFKVRT